VAGRLVEVPGPVLLARGRTADVYALDSKRVLRRYRDGGDVSPEAVVMAYLDDLGFVVPRVEAAAGTDLVMERLDGVSMLEALAAGALDIESGARLLADLHARLHALPARVSRDPTARILHLDPSSRQYHPQLQRACGDRLAKLGRGLTGD
jgi:hypothetical protein